jgi:nitrite reductase (NADH) small subunit
MPQEILAAREDEIAEGGRKVVVANGQVIGLFRIDDRIIAWRNSCPHRGGPVCQGGFFNKVEEETAPDGTTGLLRFHPSDVHLVCPWHGYEYDLRTGVNPNQPALRLSAVETRTRDGNVFLVI